MANYDISFVLLHITILMVLTVFIFITRMSGKSQIHYAFLGFIGCLLVWSIGQLLEIYTRSAYGYTIMIFVYIYFLGVCFAPISLLYLGIIHAHTKIKFSWIHNILFIPPIVSYLVLLTNQYHHLFFIKYSCFNNQVIFGKFFIFHNIIAYIYILIGLYFLIYFSIKNSGFFSKQSISIIIGTSVPFLVNILSTYKVLVLPSYSTPITFSFAVVFYMIAIFKFQFLNIVPIALQKVVDHISDAFVVIDEQYNIIDFNKAFLLTFGTLITIKRKENLVDLLSFENSINPKIEGLLQYINESISKKKSVMLERDIKLDSLDKYFNVEITPIFSQENHIGTIILFKDITEIKQTQQQLLERERLASLGGLIGGIAHDINSPLASLQCHVKEIRNLAQEYEEGIDDCEVTPEDHKEIAKEIKNNLEKMDKIANRIAGIVNSVRNHTRNLNGDNFGLMELRPIIEDIKILLGHELKHNKCELIYKEDRNIYLIGDQGKLSQVLTNLVANAIQSYNGQLGVVEVEAKSTEKEVIISISDKGQGIDQTIINGIFKEVLTTKGTKGTGLGLYISFAVITGHFRGKMWLESEIGKGTTFYISLPKDIELKEKNKLTPKAPEI